MDGGHGVCIALVICSGDAVVAEPALAGVRAPCRARPKDLLLIVTIVPVAVLRVLVLERNGKRIKLK